MFGRALLRFPRAVHKFVTERCLSDEAWCRHMFKWCHGYPLDLKNPKTLNEKIQWLKLYNRKSEFTNWADKYKVRDYIRDIFGEDHLISFLAVTDDPSTIDFDALPLPFIVKPTHSSGHAIIVQNMEEIDREQIVKTCRKWLTSNLYREGREWHYKDISPKIIVEQLLLDEQNKLPLDYKCHCFNGKVVAIQVDIDRRTQHRRNFYDPNWSRMPFTWSVCVGNDPLWPQGRDIEKPKLLSKMVEMSNQLAGAFLYARIDWYIVDGRVCFGEITFHPGGGFERILPIEWDRTLGNRLHLPTAKT